MTETPTRLLDLTLASDGSKSGANLEDRLIRPLGVVHGPAAAAAVENGLAQWLAGGPSAFTTVELIEGAGPGAERELRSLRQVALMRAPNIAARLRLLTDARPPIAGLTWVRPRVMARLSLGAVRGETAVRATRVAVQQGRRLAMDGADIVTVAAAGRAMGDGEEIDRVVPVVEALARQGIRVAVSSRRASVTRSAARAGARIVVDEAPAIDAETLYTLADIALPVVVRRGGRIGAIPRSWREAVDLAIAVHAALESRLEMFEGAGVPRDRIIVDPGIGADQPAEENIALLHSIALFHGLGCPLLADCGGLLDAARGAIDIRPIHLEPAEVAFAALAQGVQVVAAPQPDVVWSAAAAFRALSAARFDEAE